MKTDIRVLMGTICTGITLVVSILCMEEFATSAADHSQVLTFVGLAIAVAATLVAATFSFRKWSWKSAGGSVFMSGTGGLLVVISSMREISDVGKWSGLCLLMMAVGAVMAAPEGLK